MGGIVIGIREEIEEIKEKRREKEELEEMVQRTIKLKGKKWRIIMVYCKETYREGNKKSTDELEKKERNEEYILIDGDFNARTGERE